MQRKLSSKFIVLDGPDGCGKSTQLELLAQYLKKQGLQVVKARDPGCTKIGDQIRQLLKYGAEGRMNVQTEIMLFMASRAQLVAEVIKPTLEKGKTVLCDRFISATCAYQGASGYPVEKIIELGKFAVGDTWPDLTIIIDLPVKEGRKRAGCSRAKSINVEPRQNHLFDSPTVDRFDARTLKYHRKVRKLFKGLPSKYPRKVKIVDGSEADIQTVHERIKVVVLEAEF